jgi:protein-S-isoprenylcysteine O-methyltransferase Ste14
VRSSQVHGSVRSSQVHELAVLWTTICWGMTALVWISGALYTASRGPRTLIRPTLTTLSTALVAAGYVLAVRSATSDWSSGVGNPWLLVLGAAILVCATAFTLWARLALGNMWSASPIVKVDHQLRTGGPYGVTRHPIYTGLLGMLLGTAFLIGLGFFLVALPVALFLVEIRIHMEEGLMLATFPDAYPQYRRQVPQLVPGLRGFHRRTADP